MSQFSERDFRDAMGQFCTGVVIVTGRDEQGAPCGFSAQSFVSVSLAPPLVAVCPANSSRSWPPIRPTGRFGKNILAPDQQDVCARFARSGTDKFQGLPWSASATGLPRLDQVLGFFDCQLEAEHAAGDQSVVIGRVVDCHLRPGERPPLLFFRGRYGAVGPAPDTA